MTIGSQKKQSKPVTSQFRLLYKLVNDTSLEYLASQQEEMFRKLEPVIIDFASKADTNNSQAYFFDTIAVVNQKKAEIQDRFISSINSDLKAFGGGRPISSVQQQIDQSSSEAMEMVAYDDLELHLAIVNMATKVKNSCHKEIYQLGQRLATLRQGQMVHEAENPVGPTNISYIFQYACKNLDLDKERLLIFYILFEKTVMAELAGLYDRLNDELIKAGIHPNLWVPTVSKLEAPEAPERRAGTAMGQPPAPNQVGSAARIANPLSPNDFQLGEEVFQTIFSFLTERRKANPRFQNHIEYQADGDLSLLKTKPEVASAIEDAQKSAESPSAMLEAQGGGLSDAAMDSDLVYYAKLKLLEEREKVYLDLDENTIPTADLDTIELVGLLFEEVLNDENLANITKATICHLHTLYLKVAILDASFLTDANHIARRFLNLAIRAGHDWIDEHHLDKGLYRSLDEIVTALMGSFESKIDVFDHYYEMLNEQIEELKRRAKISEKRTREVTKGKDRLEYARLHAEEVIEKNFNCEYIHPLIADFIYQEWKDCMTMMLLRNPDIEKDKSWVSVLMVINSLAKINIGRGNAGIVGWINDILPLLEEHIDHGLSFLGDDHRPHSKALIELLGHWACGQFDEVPFKPKSNYVTNDFVESADKPTKQLSSSEKQILSNLKETKLGSWFEFDEADGEKRRVKLSWYSPITKKHMFIDRFGAKAYIVPTNVLVEKLLNGSTRMIERDDLPFMDKAMTKIHSLLTRH